MFFFNHKIQNSEDIKHKVPRESQSLHDGRCPLHRLLSLCELASERSDWGGVRRPAGLIAGGGGHCRTDPDVAHRGLLEESLRCNVGRQRVDISLTGTKCWNYLFLLSVRIRSVSHEGRSWVMQFEVKHVWTWGMCDLICPHAHSSYVVDSLCLPWMRQRSVWPVGQRSRDIGQLLPPPPPPLLYASLFRLRSRH